MSKVRTSSSIELFVPLDRQSDRSLHHQLEQQLRHAIRDARLRSGSTMPSSRALAAQLGVARGVVVEAYEQLAAEGYLVTRPGGSTRVASLATRTPRPSEQPEPPPPRVDFRPGRPDLTEFPRRAWARSVRRALENAPASRLGYLDGHGVPELRGVLSSYLDRVRGTNTHAADIVVTSGFIQGLQLVARVVGRSGVRRVGVEDPWHADYRRALTAAGLEVVPIPVDHEGLRVERLEAAGVDVAILTPAHQYPTGAVLSAPRRAALLDWANRHDALVIEDDYDAEFRYDREPVGAMQGLDPDRVIYAGTTSKTLAPGLRLGWLAVPHRLSDRIARAKVAADYGSGALDQLALADFIDHGELDRHLRHMRTVYRGRRDALLAGLGRLLPGMLPMGASAGLHILAQLPDGHDEGALVEAADAHGVALTGAATTYAGAFGKPGIVFGYAGLDESRIVAGLEILAALA